MGSFDQTLLVTLKDDKWFDRQKIAGQCVGSILSALNRLIKEVTPNLTLRDLEQTAIKMFKEAGCTATFLGYKGFPGAVCLSVNRQLVHGIPSDYKIQDGDVVKFDLGATYEGAIADAAATAIYGNPKSVQHVELVETCRAALNNGIKAVTLGKRLGVIGYAIQHTVKRTRFGLITNYGGHGLDENKPHASPFVPNKSQPTEGIRIPVGLTVAIEPMVVVGDTRTVVAKDGWTVLTEGVGAHFEHTIFVGPDKVHVMTEWT